MTTSEKSGRLLEAAVAVLEGANGKLNIVALNKALFYLDLYSLRDTGETVTGSAYYALENGPVIANYPRRLVKALEKMGYARQISEGMAKPIQLLQAPEHFEHLKKEDRDTATMMGALAAKRTSSLLSAVSHENLGWKCAYHREGPKERINMFLAMQQVAEPDPWIEEPPDEELLTALKGAEDAGETWL